MPTNRTIFLTIREQRHSQQLDGLRNEAQAVVAAMVAAIPSGEVWLFGSLARDDWDAFSDVDLRAIAPTRATARALVDALKALKALLVAAGMIPP